MLDADAAAPPLTPTGDEVEVPDTGCGTCVATLRVDRAQVSVVDLPGEAPLCAWRALTYAQQRARGAQPSAELLQALGRKAVTLRANVIGRILDHPDLFSPHWRCQEGATVATEDGDVPED
eukprot:7238658-Alexandrium_andersonii.AAC.1